MGRRCQESTAKVVQKELSADDAERRSKGAWAYGEMTQPRSHFVKERLIDRMHPISYFPCIFNWNEREKKRDFMKYMITNSEETVRCGFEICIK
jgi:hypothetical protein